MRAPRHLALAITFLLLPPLAFAAGPIHGSEVAPDGSRIHTYEDLVHEMAALEAAGARVSIPAVSEEGRDIYLVELGTGPYTIVLLNVLHANEPTGTEAFLRFAWALLGNEEPTFWDGAFTSLTHDSPLIAAFRDPGVRERILSEVTILGFPMLDPDGVANDHTRDPLLNTDYMTQITPGSQAIAFAMETYAPDLILDSHGGPDGPELSMGVVELQYTDPGVVHAQRRATQAMWSAAAAHGVDVVYFEEHINAYVVSEDEEDPFLSVGEIYWDAAARYTFTTQASWQLRGVPAIYTESVGLQSVDPQITLSEGASTQQLAMMSLAAYGAGLFTGERTTRAISAYVFELAAPLDILLELEAGTHLLTVDWEHMGAADHALALLRPDGGVVATSAPSESADGGMLFTHARNSRALIVDDLEAGGYTLRVTPQGAPEPFRLKVLSRLPDASVDILVDAFDPDAQAQFGESEPGLYRQLDPIPRLVPT